MSVYEEPEVALIGIQGASEGLVSGFQFNLNKKENIRHYLNVNIRYTDIFIALGHFGNFCSKLQSKLPSSLEDIVSFDRRKAWLEAVLVVKIDR